MAKSKRSAKDLDAELAALEAELAALERKATPAKAAPAAAPAPAATEATPAAAAPAPGEEKPKKKGFGFALPKLPKRAKEPPVVEAQVLPQPAAAPRPVVAAPSAPAPMSDLSQWRNEDGEWIRTVPHEPVVVRRVLDENGAVVREEPATAADLEERTPAKAERGIGRLLRRG